MLNAVLIGIVGFSFALIDTLVYAKASYPERTSSWLYKLPGGGLVAYFKFGKAELP